MRSGAVCAAGLSVPAAGRGAAVGEGRYEGRGEGAGGGDEFRTTGHELIGARCCAVVMWRAAVCAFRGALSNEAFLVCSSAGLNGFLCNHHYVIL